MNNYIIMVDKASDLASVVISDLDLIIDKSLTLDLSIPDYDSIKRDGKNLYIKYCDIVEFYNELNNSLLKARHLHLAIKEIINSIANDKSVQYTVTKEYISKFKVISGKVSSKIEMVSDYKSSLEFTIKFYQNTCYINGVIL